MASMSETSYWINFFTSAGIPAGDSAHYAVMFSDNRITREMLLDLSKEYLTDMGITRLGDIIAILKHAKDVFKQEAKDKILKSTSLTSLSSSNSVSPVSRRSTAASRMVNHFTGKHPEAAPMSQSPIPKPAPPPPEPPRSKRKVSVFDRLGSDGVEETITLSTNSNLEALSSPGQTSVFSRLGGKSGLKRPASDTSVEGFDDLLPTKDSLPYVGVLKSTGPSPAKKPTVKVAVNKASLRDPILKTLRQPVTTRTNLREPLKIKKTIKTITLTDKEEKKITHIQRPEVSTTTEGVLSDFAKREAPSLKDRLGSKTEMASVSSSSLSKLSLPVKTKKVSIQDRLGAKKDEQQSSPVVSSTQNITAKLKKVKASETSASSDVKKTSGVFSRLGKKSQT
ncbi:uncharacterized protein C19orf47-like [Physella acuta]|uniref:uncharacterized protein C19orf47-like n=1 Tax=Physella acuta TaxID=109671 RepID=UPI0027DDDB30|nr:uncharacterized protein C19orf47-like [Physella acuta]